MHIAEGVLSGSTAGVVVLGLGWAGTAAGLAWGLRQLDYERVPRVAMLSGAFFLASLIAVPVGPTSAHLVLCGLVGLVLGWTAFPAIFVALMLQMVYFPHCGGLTTLGLNTLIMALPAVICHYLFSRAARTRHEGWTLVIGWTTGMVGVLLGALLASLAWLSAGPEFRGISAMALLSHAVVGVADGLVTASVVVFLRKVRPELLEAPVLAPAQ